ncbi:MAG: hypothetical protein CSA26_01545 [Desulfobacterales bacterium]|nr:MAG: hypothetical protein CSA26_01545 [Desulfobacterales bacterium]
MITNFAAQLRNKLKNQTLVNKLKVLNFVGISMAMVIIFVLWSLMYSWHTRQELADDLAEKSQLLAANIAPMIAFQDREEAQALLGTFRGTKNLRRVVVFQQKENIPFVQLVLDLTALTPSQLVPLVREVNSTRVQFIKNGFLAFSPVILDKERIGTVIFESDLGSVKKSLSLFLLFGSMALIAGIILSAAILKRLQSIVISPIVNISEMAEKVAASKEFHLRVEIDGQDEIARLGQHFNQMLDEIELRDKRLNQELCQSRESEKELDKLARTDMLTGLPNRFAFMSDLSDALKKSLAEESFLALMFIDLDDFKQVNDTQGHHNGDKVLQITARRILSVLRDSDTLYRLGGDEFALIVKSAKGGRHIAQINKRITAAVCQPIGLDLGAGDVAGDVQIGLSIGIAYCPYHADNEDELLRKADCAMYEAKSAGKNSFRVYHKDMEEDV